jgi:hypothetical protein
LPNNPVQVVLNTKDFFLAPDARRMSRGKDFFANRDQDFVDHRDKLLRQVASIGAVLERSNISSGIVKVTLQHEALAKSHRPQRALFPPARRPCVGASNLGELYYHVTREDVTELEHEIASAETETRHRISEKSGKEYFAPSSQRSDVGAVESIELPSASEKRQFSVEEAIQWLADARTSSAYFVELFSLPPALLPGVITHYLKNVTQDIVAAAAERQLYIETFPVEVGASELQRPIGVIGVRLLSSRNNPAFNRSIEEHSRLLGLFDTHPYIRRVLLPPIVVAANAHTTFLDDDRPPTIPTRQVRSNYPKIGIIDGGLGSHLSEWTVGSHTVIAPEHQHTDHGSFIGGLLVGGQSQNGSDVCAESDGCELYDIGILPDADQQSAFEVYYPRGVVDFLRELEVGVEVARREQAIRVFNMSLNLLDPVQGEGYGVVASLLDQMADRHDIVFVISAGNLRPNDCRSEWPIDAQTALQHLASRTVVETVLQPAESSRSIAVGALNPPGCPGRVSGVPTAYTRRGPGLRVGVKPDVGHFGGALPDSKVRTGLKSWADETTTVLGHGTSYAAPLVAKTLAVLDMRVASPLTREMLLAVLVHGCELPEALRDPILSEVARQFTGFGIPAPCEKMLETPDHAITLVFADVLQANRKLQFNFAWPRGLVDQETGACRGDIRMTLVYRPTLNRDFGSEFVRVNVDAYLRQEHKGKYVSRVKQAFLPDEEGGHFEHELIEHGLKWWPIKVYSAQFPKGKGKSSNWRLNVESLVRSTESFPAAGVPFALLLTIADLDETEPVFNDLRLHLRNSNVQLSDIRATTQVRVQS